MESFLNITEHLLDKKLGRSSGRGRDSPGSNAGSASRRYSNQSDFPDQPSPSSHGHSKEANPALKKKFLKRLAIALHAYGNSSTRTEYLVEKASRQLNVAASVAVFPTVILLSFQSDDRDPAKPETHLLTVEPGLNVDKLGRADELANRVGMEHMPLLVGYWRLRAIATAPPQFGEIKRLLSFGVAGCTSAVLFFNGNLYSGALAALLGLVAGLFDLVASRSNVFANVTTFLSATCVALLSRLLALYLPARFDLCFFSMTLGSLVWLLPGLSLTVGVSELTSGAKVSGSARVMGALFEALQLGFGMETAQGLVWWAPRVKRACNAATQPVWLQLILFLLYSVASNALLQARWDQWPGMILTSAVGFFVSTAASAVFAANVLASVAIGLTGTLYSRYSGHLPVTMTLSGILILVPGGLGVRGSAALLEHDLLSGVGFTMDMLVVSLSITLGLLIAKIVLPSGFFGSSRLPHEDQMSLAAQMEDDRDEGTEGDEEDMAI
ncbi:DUF1212 domain containing protein [Klebsormidium nitens]|uniref:DUF1212 domain containing protein n=1 Tax=Klebsormidium nitens TaxID=105231 RepID=A0A0U9HKH7_KLENI|nr:DUF1212 domain containing protein [Klebsormidium nitens]|eukprot:GAQ88884.1 DUF1212 domain containing protein [Klebsormidium nitens]